MRVVGLTLLSLFVARDFMAQATEGLNSSIILFLEFLFCFPELFVQNFLL